MVVQPRAGAEEAGPLCVKLAPYAHQVGGHVAVLALDSQTICKPHIEREYQFYQDLPDTLHRFVPQYRGVADVVVQQARDGYLNLVACPYPGGRSNCLPLEGDRHADRDSGSIDQILRCPQSNHMLHAQGLQRTKPVYRVRLSESGSLSIDQDSDSDDIFEDLSLETGYRRFGCNPWSMHCHRQQIGKMWGEQAADQLYKFLLLENVTDRFDRPCILDLKIGLRSYGDDATEAKKKSHIAKIQGTTSSKLGIRVCGMQIYRPDKGLFLCRNKYYGRRLSEEGLRQAVAEFVFDGQKSRLDVVAAIMAELKSLANALSELDCYRFYGSSLLLIYEGSADQDKHRYLPVAEPEHNASHHRRKESAPEQERLDDCQPSNLDRNLGTGNVRQQNYDRTSSKNFGHRTGGCSCEDLDESEEEDLCMCQTLNPDGNLHGGSYQSGLASLRGGSCDHREDSFEALEGSQEENDGGCGLSNPDKNLENMLPRFSRNSSHHRRKDSGTGCAPLGDPFSSGPVVADGCSTDPEEDASMGSLDTAMPGYDSGTVRASQPKAGSCRLEASNSSGGMESSVTPSSTSTADVGDVKRPYESSGLSDQAVNPSQKHLRTTELPSPIDSIPDEKANIDRAEVPSTSEQPQAVDDERNHPPLVHIKMIDFAHAVFRQQTRTDPVGPDARDGTDLGRVRVRKSRADVCCGGLATARPAVGGQYEGPDRDFLYGLGNLLDIFKGIHNVSSQDKHEDLCCEDMNSED